MSLINIGLTGLQAHQSALSTTGNNVSNANTEGYSRQRVILEASLSQLRAGGYQGTGVTVADIERINSSFVTNQLRLDTSTYNEFNSYMGYIGQIDTLLADSSTGLSPGMSNFFKALHGASDDPSSIPERTLVLSEAQGLVGRFKTLYGRMSQISQNVDREMTTLVSQINSLAESIADLNTAIVAAGGSSAGTREPNELLDKRDEQIRKLSEIASVSVVAQADGKLNVFLGKGQALVVGSRPNKLEVQASDSDPSLKDIVYNENGTRNVITSEITGGKLGGIISFRDSILKDSINSMGRIALTLAETINKQHQLGIDLSGDLGGDFFTDINSRAAQLGRVTANKQNAMPADRVISVEITDTAALTKMDYEIQFNGPSNNNYVVVNKSGGQVITQGTLPGVFPASIQFDGMEVNFESGSFQQGDKFLITPTRYGARDIDVELDRVEDLALAFPIRSEANLGNTGNGLISQGEMLDVRSPLTNATLPAFAVPGQLSPPLLVRFITDTVYEVLDNSNPANPVPLNPPLNNQHYIPGATNNLFTKDPGETMVRAGGSTVAQVPAPVASPGPYLNGYGAQSLTLQSRDPVTGIVTVLPAINIAANSSAKDIATALNGVSGVRANAYSEATLSNFTDDGLGAGLGLTINGEVLTVTPPTQFNSDSVADLINNNANLQAMGFYATSDGNNLRIRATNGDDIQIEVTGSGGDSVDVSSPSAGPVTVTGGNGTAVGGQIDVTMADGISLTANNNNIFSQAPVAVSTYRGFQFSLNGEPKQGDRFNIDYNTDGVSDNRNALGLAALETAGTMNKGASTYNESYSQLVEVVGTVSNQTQLDTDAAQALLRQSESRWQETSGVNLDEEAGKLIQFQAAYNASAKVVSVARELFDTLIGAFG